MPNPEYELPSELETHIRSLHRMVYYVTDEEDVAIKAIHNRLTDNVKNTEVKVYNAAHGLLQASSLINDWESRTLQKDQKTMAPPAAFEAIYQEDTRDKKHFYLITDPERWLKDQGMVRRLLNIIHQVRHRIQIVKVLIFVGPEVVIPQKLSTYIHVVRGEKPTQTQIQGKLDEMSKQMNRDFFPPEAAKWFRGLTFYETESAVARSLVETRKSKDDKQHRRVDKSVIQEYKRDRIKKTDLLNVVDVSDFDFSKVGGLDKFKNYAERVKPAWTAEGRKFGLKPPKGVLCVGIWGCGKSLSVKALGSTWNLPVIQLEMGKLRSSAVGETEANVYKAIGFLESMAPCIAWVDEAEKSFAGAESSSKSDAGTTARTLGILSTWHQETDAEVCLCLTANSLDTLPTEFTNRIEDRFFFDVPSEDDRVEILKIQLKSQGCLNESQVAAMDLRTLAQAADDLVPREMEQAIRQALRDSFFEDKPQLDFGILCKEFENRPRILRTMDKQVKHLLDWIGYDADRDEGIRARMASSRRSKNTLEIIQGGGILTDGESSDDDTNDET
jgi:SpoVK/Ycf46/Vps4 family AAA+-type ATPase